jgi:hypothetical protein
MVMRCILGLEGCCLVVVVVPLLLLPPLLLLCHPLGLDCGCCRCHLPAGMSDSTDSSSSRVLLWLLFTIQLCYNLALAAVNPQIDMVRGLCDISCTCLETATVLCTCLLRVSGGRMDCLCPTAQPPLR